MKLEDFIKKHGNVNVDEKELKELLGFKDKKYFAPRENEECWFVSLTGSASQWCVTNHQADKHIFKNNEVFKTEEEAEEHAKKQRFLLQMKRDFLDNSEKIDWKSSKQPRYCILYHHGHDTLYTDELGYIQGNDLVTTNREWLREYIEKHEKEIKKYYFEIEEELW